MVDPRDASLLGIMVDPWDALLLNMSCEPHGASMMRGSTYVRFLIASSGPLEGVLGRLAASLGLVEGPFNSVKGYLWHPGTFPFPPWPSQGVFWNLFWIFLGRALKRSWEPVG